MEVCVNVDCVAFLANQPVGLKAIPVVAVVPQDCCELWIQSWNKECEKFAVLRDVVACRLVQIAHFAFRPCFFYDPLPYIAVFLARYLRLSDSYPLQELGKALPSID